MLLTGKEVNSDITGSRDSGTMRENKNPQMILKKAEALVKKTIRALFQNPVWINCR